MDKKLFDRLIQDLEELSEEIGGKHSKRLNISLLIRAIKRLENFSSDCEECGKYLTELSIHIENLKNKPGQIEKLELKEHQQKVNKVITHLQKNINWSLKGVFWLYICHWV